jgi:hypothetical protein
MCLLWVYSWGAHPFFVFRISHFFFILDQKWERSLPITLSPYSIRKKEKKKKSEEPFEKPQYIK